MTVTARQEYLITLTILRDLLEWKHPVNSANLQWHLISAASDKGLITKQEEADLVKQCRS
jgi:hypothetical protein